jgi:hypothetical protein
MRFNLTDDTIDNITESITEQQGDRRLEKFTNGLYEIIHQHGMTPFLDLVKQTEDDFKPSIGIWALCIAWPVLNKNDRISVESLAIAATQDALEEDTPTSGHLLVVDGL